MVIQYPKKKMAILQKPNLKSWEIVIWEEIQNNCHKETQQTPIQLRKAVQ